MKSVIFNLIVNKRVIDSHYPNMESVNCWIKYASMIEGKDDCIYLRKYIAKLNNNDLIQSQNDTHC